MQNQELQLLKQKVSDYEIIVEEILNHIKEEMNEIKFGKIVIELQDNSDKIDVVTEVRKRFNKQK